GFDDEPGVESQRILSAQRRHHVLQPITVQLHDLQVEPGDTRWMTGRSARPSKKKNNIFDISAVALKGFDLRCHGARLSCWSVRWVLPVSS
ncbi:uncharacterized, partial [Tachysurus ichikawai]